MIRITILFLPSLCGLLWKNDPGISIAWSLAGSLFIAVTAQTRWFRQEGEGAPITYKAWVCTNPDCGFNLRIDNGEISFGRVIQQSHK